MPGVARPTPMPNGALLDAHGIHKRFGALVVLDDVDLSLAGNDAVGIVGPNGAGKTTLPGAPTTLLGGRRAAAGWDWFVPTRSRSPSAA
jgi:ABC-type sugar transport system ATPase subunit